ncbi:MAG: PHP domain-containing protein, partial [Proteiniphilum sp.]
MHPFIHLHVHSQYSLLDGQASIQRLVDKAMNDGMRAIALTDHGAMYGIKEFLNYCNKKNGPRKTEIANLKKEIDALTQGEDADGRKEALQQQLQAAEQKLFKPIV